MARALVVIALVAWLGMPAAAKVLCPPGQFLLHAVDGATAPQMLRDGMPLELGAGRATLNGLCAETRAGDFHRLTGRWLFRLRARWQHCRRVRPVSLRARFDTSGSYCVQFTGTLRLGGRSFAVVGTRVPVCGNDLRESGEQCDGSDSMGGVCCAEDCTVQPGCPVYCDTERFPCAASELCVYTCGVQAVCAPREQIRCDIGPVCACDLVTTYPNRCAAFAAGTGAAQLGACQPPSPLPPVRRPRR